jgi:hypothetical protein
MAKPMPASIAKSFRLSELSPSGLSLVMPGGKLKPCGWIEKIGYWAVKHRGRKYWAHRVCYLLYYSVDPVDSEVDHIDGNGLNNNPSNLRLASQSTNQANQKLRSQNSSGYKGVTWKASRNKWCAQLTHNKCYLYLGLFDSPELAAKAYDRAATEMFGAYALTNQKLGTLPND